MVVIYKQPADAPAFDAHYFGVHVPLAKQLPGLRKYEVSRGPIISLTGGPSWHLVARLHFDDLAAIKAAFATSVGQECAADRRNLAPDDADLTMLLFDAEDV